MASMMEYARNDGVLASAEFIWLKPLDRKLWFMLNCVGRQTPFCEVAGPVAHFKIEKRLRRPLKVPMIDEAVNALEAALAEIIYQPEDM
jgi:intracellular multiplication protein IcmP